MTSRSDGDGSVRPDRESFEELADGARPAVVRAEAPLDVDVEPLEAYAALTGRTTDGDVERLAGGYAFLLESAEKVPSSDPDGAFSPGSAERHARYSFVGYDPIAVVTVEDGTATVDVRDGRYGELVDPASAVEGVADEDSPDVLDRLRAVLSDADRQGFPDRDRQLLDGGLVGFLAYDAVYDLHLDEVGGDRPDSRLPDAQFVLNTKTLVFDHAEGDISLAFTPVVRPDEDAGERYDELLATADRVRDCLTRAADLELGGFDRAAETAGSQATYEDAVRRAKEHVLDGDVYQAVISRERELRGAVDPLGFYASLRETNPSPYMYLLAHDDLTLVGASPETLVSVRDDEVVANPIAGTCPRGSGPVEDRRLAGEMLADEKERAEHTMLVDLARNDVRRVAEPGSVQVEEFMNVLKYSHVQHVESTVTGTLADDRDAFDAIRATFPAGTLSGAPKIRAMEIVDDLETTPRGVYGGGVGYVAWNGDADLAIVIRSATIESRRGGESDETPDRIAVRAGAGIVADSVPEREYEETERKMAGVLDALEGIEDGPTVADPVAGEGRR
ncbi:MAG: anthranilate synthase component I [Halanaeroarchaeum sp.]